MVGNVTIQGQITGTATFDGAKISAVVTIAPPINATVVFGRSGVSVHNLLSYRDAEDAHPIASITGLTEVLETIPAPIGFTPENVANKKTTLTNSETDYPSTSSVNRLSELKQTDSPEFANTQITTLQSDATGGDIAAVEATWLGATAKSVLSYLQKLLSNVYAINSRVAVLENNIIADFVTTSTLTTIDVTGLNFVDGDVFTVECIGTSAVENGNCLLALNNKKVTEYWYNGSIAYQGFLGVTGGFYRNVWTVRVNTFNCFCSSDHSRATAAGNAFVMFAANSQTKPTTIGGLVATPVTTISITTNPNGLAAGTRIIVKK